MDEAVKDIIVEQARRVLVAWDNYQGTHDQLQGTRAQWLRIFSHEMEELESLLRGAGMDVYAIQPPTAP